MRAHRSAVLALTLLLPACASQTPALQASSLAAMRRNSVDSVDITLGPMTLGFFRLVGRLGREDDPHGETPADLLRGLHKVHIRSFQFATNYTYRQADLEALQSQLTAPGWQRVAHVRDSRANEDVNIYCSLHDHPITRVVIVDAEPREFTLINIVGTIDPHNIGLLRQRFIPRDRNRSELTPIRADATQNSRNAHTSRE